MYVRLVRIGSPFGIPFDLDLAWMLVATAIALALTPFLHGFWVAALTAILIYGCVLLHELGHIVVARHYGYHIDRVLLGIFGGTSIFHEPSEPSTEWRIALAGPLVSFILALFFAMLAVGLDLVFHGTVPLVIACVTLMLANVVVAGFNVLPLYPLDGGRVLYAVLCWRTHDPQRSMKIVFCCSIGLSLLLIATFITQSIMLHRFIGELRVVFAMYLAFQAYVAYKNHQVPSTTVSLSSPVPPT